MEMHNINSGGYVGELMAYKFGHSQHFVRGKMFFFNLCFSVSFPVAPPYPSGSFDRILLDAPCSALGQRPQFVVKMTLKELQSYPRLQRKLFTTVRQ